MINFIPSRKEMEEAIILDRIKRKEITQMDAAKIIGITDRQVRSRLKKYNQEGLAGLIHKNRGKESKKKWNCAERSLSVDLLKSEWEGFGPTFMAEKLQQFHGIKISKETMRKVMIEEGLWSVGRARSQHRKKRNRKECFGMMSQFDGSEHDWFEGRAAKCTLLLFVDDATGRIWGEFAKSESVASVMRVTLNYLKIFGCPASLYTDYGSVFSVNLNNKERNKITQYDRALREVGIELILARSPQAKGRVERSFQTHQDRLTKELRMAKISTMEEANLFLQNVYFKEHNDKFAIDPAQSIDVHKSTNGFDLKNIFCIREERVVNNDFTVQYKNRIFQINNTSLAILRPKDKVLINHHLNGVINIFIRKSMLDFSEVKERPKTEVKESIKGLDLPKKPCLNSQLWASNNFMKNKTSAHCNEVKS